MRILADENIHAGLVRWLRDSGHDVLYAAEQMASWPDVSVLEMSAKEQRVLLTDDKDFGELSIRRQLRATGIILVRLTRPTMEQRVARLKQIWDIIEKHAVGNLVVIGEDKVRVRELPR